MEKGTFEIKTQILKLDIEKSQKKEVENIVDVSDFCILLCEVGNKILADESYLNWISDTQEQNFIKQVSLYITYAKVIANSNDFLDVLKRLGHKKIALLETKYFYRTFPKEKLRYLNTKRKITPFFQTLKQVLDTNEKHPDILTLEIFKTNMMTPEMVAKYSDEEIKMLMELAQKFSSSFYGIWKKGKK